MGLRALTINHGNGNLILINMKQINYLILVWLAVMGLLMVSCGDDEGLRFTKDEVVGGDVLTGRQIPLAHNELNVYTTEEGSVNVQGASGTVSAVSSDAQIATVRCINEGQRIVVVHGVKEGKVSVSVTDDKGQTATFVAVITDVAKSWHVVMVMTTEKIMDCRVEGASPADSMAIVEDAKRRFAGLKYVVRLRTFFPTNLLKITIYNKDNEPLEEHYAVGDVNQEDKVATLRYDLFDKNAEEPLERMTFDARKGFERNVVRYYRERYPGLKSVLLRMDMNVNSRL